MADLRGLERVLDRERTRGRRIVLTNGCFDILHIGHLRYLEEARSRGDLLVVGVNSDESVRRLKGDGRPIVPEHERAALLDGLAVVDLVTIFSELTPRRLIRTVRPDVYVKGGDYAWSALPERDLVESLGGTVEVLTHVPQRSTTALIERFRTSTPD
jgi:rfaE bifunctional protein nucleotidyltransferase chain/domain